MGSHCILPQRSEGENGDASSASQGSTPGGSGDPVACHGQACAALSSLPWDRRVDPGGPALATCRSAHRPKGDVRRQQSNGGEKTYTRTFRGLEPLRLGPTLAPPPSQKAAELLLHVLRGKRGMTTATRASLCHLEEGTPSCGRASNAKIEICFMDGSSSSRECRRASVRLLWRRRTISLGKGLWGFLEAGCAPRRPVMSRCSYLPENLLR